MEVCRRFYFKKKGTKGYATVEALWLGAAKK
jgi:hypothetical protein